MKKILTNFYLQVAISTITFFLITFLITPKFSFAEVQVSKVDNTFVMFDDFVSLDRVKLTNKFYNEHPSDQYDFLYFFYDSDSGSGANFVPVKSSNIFLSKTEFPFDNSKLYGSTTRLLGTVIDNITLTKLDRSGSFIDTLFFRTLQHELFHYWGIYLPQTLSDATCDDSHWVGYIGSHLSCGGDSNNKFFENNSNYFYNTNCFGIPKFNDFELYSMGLKSLQDVKEKIVVYNPRKDFINDLKVNSDCEKVTSVPKDYILKSYSIQDFINVLGPSIKQSKNNFNVAFILVKPFGSTASSDELRSLNWWAMKSPIAWYKATGGLSTLNNLVPNDSRKPIISNVKVTKDHSGIDISWQTDKPSVSAISLKNSRFGYRNIMYRSKLSPPEYSISHSISVTSKDDSNIEYYGSDDYIVDKIISIDDQLNVGEYVLTDSKPQTIDNGVKSLDIINPQGGVMHMADSDLYVDWQANNLNVDHYYVLLQNELVNDVGLIVSDNITSTSSYLSYHFNLSKKVIDQMVKLSKGLTEGQLQNHYYVTVVAANRGFFGGSKPEYYAKSKVFYIGPSSGIMISSVNATANPLYSSNATVAYRYDISFDLSNSSSSPIYINKNLNGDGVLYSVSYREASTSRIITDSQTLAGDTNTHYYLQPGQSRRITLSGYLKNGGYSELITFKILGIMAKTEYSSVDNLKVDAGFDNARLTVYIDGRIQNTSATSSLSQIILGSPIISNNYTRYYYPVEIKFNITAQDSPVYIANLVNGKSPLVFTDSDRHIMPQLTSSNSVPDNLIGDSVFYKMVPPGASRSFSYKGTVSNIGAKYTGDKIIQVKAIKYGLSADRVDSEYIGTDNSNLKAFVYMVADENATSSTVYDPKSVYIKNARSQATGPNVQNGKVVGYNFSMVGKIVNINDDPVYIRNKNDGNDRTGFLVPNSARVEYSVNYSPISAGDSNGAVIIPARSEKDIYINGTLFSNGYNGNVSYGLNSIAYGTSTYTFDRRIQDGVSDMKVVVAFDVASSTYYSTTTVFSPKLNNLSTYNGLPGTSVIAYGQDFCPAVKNVVTFASERYDISDDKAVISGDARSIRFTVPSLPSGVYKIFVEPSGATWNSPKCNPSNYLSFTIGTSTPVYSPTPAISTSVAPKSSATPSPSVASVASTSLPYITSISPSRGGENANVTVYGRNLSNVTSVQFYDRNGYPVRGLVPSYVSAQSVSFRITNEFAVSLPSAVYSLSLVSSNCRGGCDSNRINFELIGTAQASVSPSPSSSATRTPTPYPSASNTPYPSASNTPTPTYSSTPVPTYSSTPAPTYSATPTPSVSSTPTPTPVSSATPTPTQASTPTPSASASATPTPSTSSTPRPSISSSPSPSSSPTAFNNELFKASIWVALKSIFGI